MRDIRTDLQERLDAVARDREELQRRISESELVETSIRTLLKRENEKFGAPAPVQAERNFGGFSPKDAVGNFIPKDTVSSFADKEPVVTFAHRDTVGAVKPSQWGELKLG